ATSGPMGWLPVFYRF
uniref:Conorfamide-Sr3 n=1 Tax=Conus spurius TaxID=192919 RepID=CRFA3_CONSP|nr:RecName: Full=Conorfamide-Sr3; Short=CNF-Sr3; AltName: Full=Cono-RFamide-Sr3 [Conus spurius]